MAHRLAADAHLFKVSWDRKAADGRCKAMLEGGIGAGDLLEAILDLTRFPAANRFLPPDQVRGHASLENALAGDARIPAIGPDPVADLRHVFAVLADIARMLDQGVAKLLLDVGRRDAEARHALDDFDRQMEAVEFIQDDHVERRRRGALFL